MGCRVDVCMASKCSAHIGASRGTPPYVYRVREQLNKLGIDRHVAVSTDCSPSAQVPR